MIVCRSLTPKTSFEARLFSLGLMGQPQGNGFSHYPPAATLRESAVILLEAIFIN